MIKLLKRYNLYPIGMTWTTSRTRVLMYRNGYVKVIVERELLNGLFNSLLYRYV